MKKESVKNKLMRKKYRRKVISLFTTLVLVNFNICFFKNENSIEIKNVNVNINIVNKK
ncbi:MAG: hypothetical protein E6X52_08990 [Actinomyces sp.]|nr:hypothetical protein [Actinomyces sp.]MDU7081994.1 hypothetical protein [Clostridioides difficile]